MNAIPASTQDDARAAAALEGRLAELAAEWERQEGELAQLREVVAGHAEYDARRDEHFARYGDELARLAAGLEALVSRVDALAGDMGALRDTVLDLAEDLLQGRDELRAALKAALEPPSQPEAGQLAAVAAAAPVARLGPVEYQQLVQRVGRVVRDTLPADAAVLVVSRGDPELLRQSGRRARHFPQREDGVYAGFYPADSAAAIAHLEVLRAQGAEFLCFPSTALWWLDHYAGLRRHLEQRYRVVAHEPGTCLIFSLGSASRRETLPEQSADVDRYRLLIRQIREVVDSLLPASATVVVVSRGDPELLQLGGHPAWHFPQTADGTYAGYSPGDSVEAIAHLEAVRARGGDYLLFPSTAFWWLDYYQEFRQHLEQHCRLVTKQQSVCIIFALREERAGQGVRS